MVPVKREETYIYLNKYKTTLPAIKRTQFPLALLWQSCTVHKVQGLSSISVVVSFDLENQILFNEGQMYVALSRVTKIDNLFLIVKYSPFVFKVNENAVIEYSRLRENLFDRIFKDHIRGVHIIKIKHAITKSKHRALVSKVWRVFALANFCFI